MDVQQLLEQLRRSPGFMRNVTHWHVAPARPARVAPFPPALDGRLIDALARRGITDLYTHQARALEAALAGQHVAVVTPTASGKTLCYNLPVLNALLQDRTARALYLFPTKALAQDQLAELKGLLAGLDAGVTVGTYDGDTPDSARSTIRRQTRILISNPDMLHAGILPYHTRWTEFFANLRFIVIDELHTYRGVFGSHVTNVLRRLQRIARFYGSAPQFICSSATIANPRELAAAVTESAVTLVDEDGSPQGEKHFIFYNPPVVDKTLGIRRPVLLEARDIAAQFLAADIQTIVFARSRLSTEVLLTYLREGVEAAGRPGESVRGYRGGYLPNERRGIERGLRDGSVRGVVATNALELGIDIGQLSAAVLTGYPGTIASTWQQAGRAGRRAGVSAAVYVASASPLDQYMVHHPQYFFGRSPERGLVAADNLAILVRHLRCAAFELPFEAGERFGQFAHTQEVLEFLGEEGSLRSSAGRWHWMNESYPAQDVSLRAAGDSFAILETGDAESRPQTIGQLDRFSVPQLLHPEAIYMHEGQAYHVDTLDWERALAYVHPVEVDYYTDASLTTKIDVTEVVAAGPDGVIGKGHGAVLVRSQAHSYKKIKLHTHEMIGRGKIDLPELTLPTSAYWLAFPETLLERLRAAGAWQGEPLTDYGPNWAHQRALARARDEFRCRNCGAPEEPGRQHEVHHLRPFREFEYRAGRNDRYLAANELSNLVTFCPTCHRQAEAARQLRSTLAGLAHVLRHVAPLFLMCDARDLGVVTHNIGVDGQPTLFIYDRAPAGLGFSEALFELPAGVLLGSAGDVVRGCACDAGCPSCVGAAGELSGDVKGQVVALVDAVVAGGWTRTAGEETEGRAGAEGEEGDEDGRGNAATA